MTPSPFACSSCADSTFPSPCPHASANVAVHLILVATIGPRVLWQGFLGEGECRCQGLPRGGCAGPHQCLGPGHGSSTLSCFGWQETRSCCRWSVPLYRGAQLAIGTRMVAVVKRDGTPRSGADRTNGGGACFCTATQGALSQSSQVRGHIGGARRISWRPLVQKGAGPLGRTGCRVSSASSFHARVFREGGVAFQVELHVGLQCGSFIRPVAGGCFAPKRGRSRADNV